MDELRFEIWLRERLHTDERLGALRRVVVDSDPRWARELRIRGNEEESWARVDEETFGNTFRRYAFRRGETYRSLVRTYGAPHARDAGFVLGRGKGPTRTLIFHADDYLLASASGNYRFGNAISGGTTVGDEGWALRFVAASARDLPVAWATVHSGAEYEAKNMERRRAGGRAIGRNVLRWLPGVYWLNVFGEPYTEIFGVDRLLSAPAETELIGDCVGIRLADAPDQWSARAYRRRAAVVLQHLGPERFFDRERDDDPFPTNTLKVVVP